MFSLDPKTSGRVAERIRRVLVVDPNSASARLVADLMKSIGTRQVAFENTEQAALIAARDMDPQIIFVERSGEGLDGESFTRRLRRSNLSCRMVPVIMITADATATSIKGARDAGVHEFVRKPFTSGDIIKRVEVVSLKSRNWVEALGYVGPDRRRFNSADYKGPRKRQSEAVTTAADASAATIDQAMRIIASAHERFDTDPMQAVRALRSQVDALRGTVASRPDMGAAIEMLGAALSEGNPTRQSLGPSVQALLKFADAASLAPRHLAQPSAA